MPLVSQSDNLILWQHPGLRVEFACGLQQTHSWETALCSGNVWPLCNGSSSLPEVERPLYAQGDPLCFLNIRDCRHLSAGTAVPRCHWVMDVFLLLCSRARREALPPAPQTAEATDGLAEVLLHSCSCRFGGRPESLFAKRD